MQLRLSAVFGVWAQQHNKTYSSPEVCWPLQRKAAALLAVHSVRRCVQAYAARQQTFAQNLEAINSHNAQNLGWTVRFVRQVHARQPPRRLADSACAQMAVNQFADLTPEEFRATQLGLNPATGGQFRCARSQAD